VRLVVEFAWLFGAVHPSFVFVVSPYTLRARRNTVGLGHSIHRFFDKLV